jgi:hypothetical protein
MSRAPQDLRVWIENTRGRILNGLRVPFISDLSCVACRHLFRMVAPPQFLSLDPLECLQFSLDRFSLSRSRTVTCVHPAQLSSDV